MPASWWLALEGVRPPVRMEHLHAVVSGWLDTDGTHREREKAYSLSPLSERDGEFGFQLGVVLDRLSEVLLARLRAQPRIRLGSRTVEVRSAEVVRRESWRELSRWSGARAWRVELLTPLSHRSGSRSSPLPNVPAIVRGLAAQWERWGPDEAPEARPLGRELWVSDLELRSVVTGLRGQIVSGSLGTLVFRCDAPTAARQADRLLRLAPYTGIGSGTVAGTGVCETTPVAGDGDPEP